jgi:hypothetical protein
MMDDPSDDLVKRSLAAPGEEENEDTAKRRKERLMASISELAVNAAEQARIDALAVRAGLADQASDATRPDGSRSPRRGIGALLDGQLSRVGSVRDRKKRIPMLVREQEPGAVNFWNSLEIAERHSFAAVAQERVFARGARLMQEGEQAEYAMLIRAGRTQIIVADGSGERVIAERGPGQLIGERSALRVNVRSATVVALETVHALIMATEDFANFVSAHPRVLDVVESQIYDRLTEEPAGHELSGWPGMLPREPAARPWTESPRRHPLTGENCTVLLTDVVGFGARSRSDLDRRIIRRGSLDMMQASLGSLWDACITEDRGDGLLIVVPPEVPTATIVERLHRELPGELAVHNRTYGEQARIQLRVAVNVGPVMADPLGMSGDAIIRTARLIEAATFKEAMASTGASLGIIASTFVYEVVIRNTGRWIDLEEYSQVKVDVKESNMEAWMTLIDRAPRRPGSVTR